MANPPSVWQQVRAIVQLPFMVTVVVPACILLLGDGPADPWLPAWISWLLGVPLLTAGLVLMVTTIRLFARVGRGTLAPWDPTRQLVVVGPYRHVRNPMITGVFAVLLGETLLFQSRGLLIWCGAFVVVNILYIRFWETPRLRRRFGAQYDAYAANVPAWIPRASPWQPGQ